MTTGAERMKKLRKRRRAGVRVLRVEISIDVVEVLIEFDYLSVEYAHDFEQIADALSRFIDDATTSVTSHGITLDSW